MMEPDSSLRTLPGSAGVGDGVGGIGWGEGGAAVAALPAQCCQGARGDQASQPSPLPSPINPLLCGAWRGVWQSSGLRGGVGGSLWFFLGEQQGHHGMGGQEESRVETAWIASLVQPCLSPWCIWGHAELRERLLARGVWAGIARVSLAPSPCCSGLECTLLACWCQGGGLVLCLLHPGLFSQRQQPLSSSLLLWRAFPAQAG